jgi:hypothetical protein
MCSPGNPIKPRTAWIASSLRVLGAESMAYQGRSVRVRFRVTGSDVVLAKATSTQLASLKLRELFRQLRLDWDCCVPCICPFSLIMVTYLSRLTHGGQTSGQSEDNSSEPHNLPG